MASSNEIALRINTAISNLQRELRCGICCSTYKNPTMATCMHVFCKDCLEECFRRQRKLFCPVCRQVLDRRSCAESSQHNVAVQKYLKLSKAFKKDVQCISSFSVPPEKKFYESQVLLDETCALEVEEVAPEEPPKPAFAVPILPNKKKPHDPPKTRKLETTVVVEQEGCRSAVVQVPGVHVRAKIKEEPEAENETKVDNAESKRRRSKQKEVVRGEEKSVQCDLEPTRARKDVACDALPMGSSLSTELRNVDFQELVRSAKQSSEEKDFDEIDALFSIAPSLRAFMTQNLTKLTEKLGQTRVDVGKQEEEEDDDDVVVVDETHPEVGPSSVVLPCDDAAQIDVGAELKVKSREEHEEDEIVEDSEPENVVADDVDDELKSGQADTTTTQDESTLVAVCNDSQLIENELERTPIVFTVSRLRNQKDYELIEQFHGEFLSNACRFEDDVGPTTTHLVMMNTDGRKCPQKSLQFAFAVARHCMIVCRDWLTECLHTKTILSPELYTITSSGNLYSKQFEPLREVVGDSQQGWQRSRDSPTSLFAGWRLLIQRKFAASPSLDYQRLIELSRICGASMLDSGQKANYDDTLIVFASNSVHNVDEAKRVEKEFGCRVVIAEWILDSICEYKVLPVESYRVISIGK